MADVRVLIEPHFEGPDRGDGGIRRVVEAQHRWLPKYGIEVVKTLEDADVVAVHAGTWVETSKPIVSHCHGLYWEGYQWPRWAHAMNRDVIRSLRQADAVTAPSRWVADALKRGMWLDPEVMYHGIEPDDWPTPVSQRQRSADIPVEYVLWNKSRIDPVCDPTPVNELAQRAPGVVFKTTFGNKSSNVEVTGSRPYLEAIQQVREASVYLATSRETFGIGTLEAMAAGVPVLGWRWGGQAEFVVHRKHGWLAEVGNYDDLLEGLEYCLANRERLGAEARREALTYFSWESRIAPYAEMYKRLAREARERTRVSVVITNYNLGKYLPQAVASAKQGPDVQVIVVDDASTEPLPDEVANDTTITIVRNKENLYLAEALNRGIGLALGRYIIPLDADNVLAPSAIKTLADELDKDRSLDIAYGKMHVLREGTRESFVSDWPPAEANLDEQIEHRNQISSTAMYRRRVWDTVGGYRRRCHTAEDADFWCRALAVGFKGRRVTDAVTLVYRDRADSMSHTQRDWSWHRWYRWATDPETRSFAAGGAHIPTHEFPIVSVIIPVGNGHGRYVIDALDSLQNQTFRRWEAVVVNDTGSDLENLPSWARVVDTTEGKRGASAARNLGLDVSEGPLVVFLDADDWLHPDALENMFKTINEVGGFVYGDWFAVEPKGTVRKDAPEWDANMVLRHIPYAVTCMYKREDLLRGGVRWDEGFDKGWEDWDFALQVVAKAGICGSRVASPLFYYRATTGTLRDQAYLSRDTLKQKVLDKWGDYISGKKENAAMAGGCGCGGGRFSGVSSYQGANGSSPPTGQADPALGEAVSLEYTSQEAGSRAYRGFVSGQHYRFGTDDAHRIRKVYKVDVPRLLTLGVFREVSSDSYAAPEALEAKGPPVRDAAVA